MIRRILFTTGLLAPAIFLVAQTAPKAPAAKKAAPKANTAKAAPAGGDITGRVLFSGTPPKNKVLKMDADPTCVAQHAGPVVSEDVLINPDNTVQNVLVYVKAGVPAASVPPLATTPIKVDQKGCIYQPRMVVAMVNQPIEFSNSDPTNHHIQAMAEVNSEYIVSQNKGAAPMTTKFDKPEIGILVICHLHSWMRMFVSVMANPYYAVTGKDGTFTIKGLPAGYYTVEAWHEKFGTQTMKLQAGSKADFTFKEE